MTDNHHQSEITTNRIWQGIPLSSRTRTQSQQISGAARVRYAADITKTVVGYIIYY